jgi:hypothetical protein
MRLRICRLLLLVFVFFVSEGGVFFFDAEEVDAGEIVAAFGAALAVEEALEVDGIETFAFEKDLVEARELLLPVVVRLSIALHAVFAYHKGKYTAMRRD